MRPITEFISKETISTIKEINILINEFLQAYIQTYSIFIYNR